MSRRAGVSLSTASRVLSGSPHHVAPATRERVLRAARQIGYAPAAVVRATRRRRAALIGVVVGDISDPYFGELARVAEDTARRHGYMTLVASGDRDPAKELEQLRLFLADDAAGIVLASESAAAPPAELVREVMAALAGGVTVVSIGASELPGPHVRVDTVAASTELTAYLISLGHRQVTFLAGPAALPTAERREAGYRAAMEAAGFAADVRPAGLTHAAGAEAAMALLAEGALPDALLCFNDEAAVGVLTALDDAHIAVPTRVSLAGMGNSLSARLAGMTTVDLAPAELGRLAVERILGEGGDDIVVPHRLVPRGSVRPRT